MSEVMLSHSHTGCVYRAEEGFSPLQSGSGWNPIAEQSTFNWSQSVLLAGCCSISTSGIEGMNQISYLVQKNNYCVWLWQVICWYVVYVLLCSFSTNISIDSSWCGVYKVTPWISSGPCTNSCFCAVNTDSTGIDISVCSKESITLEQ